MFSKDTYQRRRNALKQKLSGGVVVFLGNIENPVNFADNTYPFRQDSNFLYYFGIIEPGLAAVIDVDEGKTIVFGDELTIDQIVWMGRLETIHAKAEKSGVPDALPSKSLVDYVKKASDAGRKVHYLPPYQSSNKILLSNLLGLKIAELAPSVELIKAIVSQRAFKEDQEIAEIEKAVNVSNQMHLLAMRMAKAGMKEYELGNAVENLAANVECRLAYPSIITINGQVLHNHYQGNTLKSGDMILNDSGAETAMGYAGDLTRTFPVDRKFTTRQREMYNIVHQSFLDSQSIMKPGVNFKEVHLTASQTIVRGLTELGLMKGDPEEAVRNNAHTLFLQCGSGHMMGLDVHDMEDLGEQYVGYTQEEPKDTSTFGWKSLRLGRPLEKGFVVTVEPGIYIIPELIDIWQSENKNAQFIDYDKVNEYRNFGGIRIEDNFLITDEGYKLLGDGLIHSCDEVESFRSQFV